MKQQDIGDVIVVDDRERITGIVTDRDIAVRAVAEAKDPQSTTIGEICTQSVTTVSPDTPVEEAVKVMRDQAIRRLPVADNGQPLGIVSIGDLAIERDERSALADISAAPADS